MVENAYLERATGRRGGRPTPPIAHSLQSPSYELIGQGWGQCHTKRQEPDVGNGKCHSVSAKAATRLSTVYTHVKLTHPLPQSLQSARK